MSNNPFGELPTANPYATPEIEGPSLASGNPLQIPAIALLVLSSLFVLLILASIPGQILRMRAIDTSTSEGTGELLGGIMSLILWPLMNLAIAQGTFSMLRLSSYRNAYTAAILAIIPVCSPCFLLGIPFGIWSIVVLNRPEVKQRFMKS